MRRSSLLVLLLLVMSACTPTASSVMSSTSSADRRAASATAASVTAASATAASATAAPARPPTPSAIASSVPEEKEFVACGCGCCAGVDPIDECVDVAKGETLASIEAASRRSVESTDCSVVGCSRGVRYRVCVP